MDATAVMHMIEDQIPFNHLVGAQAVAVSAERAVFRLAARPELHNHIQTLHAAALFTLAEGTSGALVAVGFPVERYLLVLKSAEVRYRRLATTATAEATVAPDQRSALLAELDRAAQVDIPITVVVRNQDDEAAVYGSFVWALRAR